MRYVLALVAAITIVWMGGMLQLHVEPMTWPAHTIVVASFIGAGLAARQILKH